MRRNGWSVLVTVLLSAALLPAPGQGAEFSSRVERVVLYPGMAEVTRVVEVDRPEASVVLKGLTPTLLPESLSARVERGGERISGVSVEDVFRPGPADERVAELARRIEELEDAKRQAEEAAAAGRREKELLDRGVLAIYAPGAGGPGSAPERSRRLSVPDVEAALSLYRARVEALDGKVFEKERTARDLSRRVKAARSELDKIRNPRPTQEKVVRIDLDRPGRCRLAVVYRVPSAGFVPRYNARLSPAGGTLALEFVADAWQRTGEDWSGVALTFSTARPGRTAQLPPLPPWQIDFGRPPIVRPMGKARMGTAAGAPTREMVLDAAAPVPVRRFTSLDVTVAGGQDLGGNGERKTFLLARREQKTRVAWRAVPKATDGAFLAADGRNETGLPWLEAPVALFVGDAYVGRGRLSDIPEGGDFRIEFGRDPSVPVTRKERARTRENGGVFSPVKRVRFRYEITARNLRKETVPLTVLDRIPVPRHKDIVVKDVEIAEGGRRGEQGKVSWKFALGAGETRVLGLSFTVEYPADKEIHGL